MTNERYEEVLSKTIEKVDKLNNQFLKLKKHTAHIVEYKQFDLKEIKNYVASNNIPYYKITIFVDGLLEKIELDNSNRIILRYDKTINFDTIKSDLFIVDMKNDDDIFFTIGFNEYSYYTSHIFGIKDIEKIKKHFYREYDIDVTNDKHLNDLISDIDFDIEEMENGLVDYCRDVKSIRNAYRQLDYIQKNQLSLFKEFLKTYKED
ncbi:V-type ATP synthase subunit I domain-containing protein [Mammaliicoccus sciuri]|uniref:hypothetical protein n=1 Tax=Mammaliicoccus sciuri TaxID=1296 RepID=UPI002B25CE77|nr:hypothetical protein [Mammaliicoccus sciuri]WQK75183.1 hypothetical protein P3U33_05495 [Mammaliicoccus sciuri]